MKIKKEYFEITGIFVISRLLVLMIAILSASIIEKGEYFLEWGTPTNALDLFHKWDSHQYLSIIQTGYSYIPGKMSNVAFFPLYPLLIKLFSAIFGHPVAIGFIISNIALLLASIYFYKLIKLDYKDSTAMKSIFFLLISPVSFFFSIVYTEGLFLFLVISCFYYARKKQWLLASILAGLATLTRGTIGFILIFPLLMEYFDLDFRNLKPDLKKIKSSILYLLLIPASLIGFMIYLYIKFNEPLAFIKVQAGWGRGFSSIFTTLSSYIYYPPFFQFLFLDSVIVSIVLILYLTFQKTRASYITYSILLLFLYLSTRQIYSIHRYVGVIFPLYLGLALLSQKHRFFDYLLTAFSIMLLTILTMLFVNGYFWMF